jgi:hypothetical protein
VRRNSQRGLFIDMTDQTLGAVREVSLLIVFSFNYQPSKLDITKIPYDKHIRMHMPAMRSQLQIYKIAGLCYMLPRRRVCNWTFVSANCRMPMLRMFGSEL